MVAVVVAVVVVVGCVYKDRLGVSLRCNEKALSLSNRLRCVAVDVALVLFIVSVVVTVAIVVVALLVVIVRRKR